MYVPFRIDLYLIVYLLNVRRSPIDLITNGNNKILAYGFNTNTRSKFLHRHDCCMHAEMAAVNNFINCRVRTNPKRYCF